MKLTPLYPSKHVIYKRLRELTILSFEVLQNVDAESSLPDMIYLFLHYERGLSVLLMLFQSNYPSIEKFKKKNLCEQEVFEYM